MCGFKKHLMAPNGNNSFWKKLSQKMHFKSTTNAFQQKYKGSSLQTENDRKGFTLKINFYWTMSLVNADTAFL